MHITSEQAHSIVSLFPSNRGWVPIGFFPVVGKLGVWEQKGQNEQNAMLKFSWLMSSMCNFDKDMDIESLATASVFRYRIVVLSWHFGTKTVWHQSKVSTRHFGTKEIGAKMSEHFGTSFLVPNCSGAEVSGYQQNSTALALCLHIFTVISET